MVRHSAIVGPPSFHVGRNDRVGAEVVAGGPDRVMMWSRAVIAKKRPQVIAPNDVAELIVERPSLFYRRVDKSSFKIFEKLSMSRSSNCSREATRRLKR